MIIRPWLEYILSWYIICRPPAVPLFPVFSFIFLYFENPPLNSCEKPISPLFPLFLEVWLPLIPVFSFFLSRLWPICWFRWPRRRKSVQKSPNSFVSFHFWLSDPIMYSFEKLWYRCYLNFIFRAWNFPCYLHHGGIHGIDTLTQN